MNKNPENMSERELLAAWGRTLAKRCANPSDLSPLSDRENAICDELVARGYDEDTMDDLALLEVQA